MTAAAEAEDCFFKPQFLYLFNGGVALLDPDMWGFIETLSRPDLDICGVCVVTPESVMNG